MNVALKALMMATKIALRSPEARYAQPEAKSHCIARSSRGLIWTRDGNNWCMRIYCSRFFSGCAVASDGARGYIALGAFVWTRGGVE